jgi:hypothetical protein
LIYVSTFKDKINQVGAEMIIVGGKRTGENGGSAATS